MQKNYKAIFIPSREIVLVLISINLLLIRNVCAIIRPPINLAYRTGSYGSTDFSVLKKELDNEKDERNCDQPPIRLILDSKSATSNSSMFGLGAEKQISVIASAASATTSSAVQSPQSMAGSDQLTYVQTMAAGALSRSMAQTIMHPANTYKTMLQLKGSGSGAQLLSKLSLFRLLRGVDAQFCFSLPHGALYFSVIDHVKTRLDSVLAPKFSFLQDFAASTISTIFCSIVSTPQMVLTDRLMAGVYPSFPAALTSIMKKEGVRGFYAGWWPALAQKIPSYG